MGASSHRNERLVLQFPMQALYCIAYLAGGRLVVVVHGDGGEVGACPYFIQISHLVHTQGHFGTDEHLRV